VATARRGPRNSKPENEQKALSLWIEGATFQQIAEAGERPFDGIRLSFDQLV
jgi:hypothetical protein